jgi:hypothetical protein
MIHDSKLPKFYWSFAYLTAAYIHNQISNSRVDSSPLKRLFGIKPSPNKLYPFGAQAIVHIPKDVLSHLGNKLDKPARECILLGYPKAGSGWLFYSPSLKHMIHSTSAVFPEYQHLQIQEACEGPELPGTIKPIEGYKVDAVVCQIELILGGELTK